jgi:hypothetical protein
MEGIPEVKKQRQQVDRGWILGGGTVENKIQLYHTIYEQVYENPGISSKEIGKRTGISGGLVSQYLKEMYEKSIMGGPFIFLKIAQNFLRYSAFCKAKNLLKTFESITEVPSVFYASLTCGDWNIQTVSDAVIDFSVVEGITECFLQEVKSATQVSKVVYTDWDTSMEKIQELLSPPEKESTLHDIIPDIPWGQKEWDLYEHLKLNTRVKVLPVIRKCNITYKDYQTWVKSLPQYAYIQPTFFPHGLYKYFTFDFLFESVYHRQLTHILGMLPFTSVFFSVGNYLYTRLTFLDIKERDSLFSLIYQLEDLAYITNYYVAFFSAIAKTPKRRIK